MEKKIPSSIINPQSLRVLMVEDSEDDALLIIRELKKGGYNPVNERVETAAAMKKALQEKQWDIILCDYKMPKFSGPSALAVLKEANIDIPLIIVSGTIGEDVAIECMRLGAQDYIMKSNLSRLCPAIDRELEEAEVRNKQRQAENALRESETKLQTIFDKVGTGIFIIDRDTQIITEANQAAIEMTGLSKGSIIGQICNSLVCPALAGKCPVKDLNQIIHQSERKLLHADGHQIDILKTVHLVTINGRNCYLESFIDITERKKVEESLKKSEDQYRLLADNMTAHIWLMDLNTIKTIYVSPSVQKMYGYTSDEIIKLSLKKFLTAESLQKMRDSFSNEMPKALANPLPYVHKYSLELEACHKDGHLLWIENTLSILRDENGKPAFMLGETRDVTERKRAESQREAALEALRESEYKYKSLIENIPDIIFTIDLEGRITFISKRTKEIIGYENEEMIKMNIFNFIPEEDHQSTIKSLRKGMKGEKIKNIQMPVIAKSGEKLFFEFSFSRIYKDGAVVGAQGTAVDINERKLVEEKLQKDQQELHAIMDASPIGVSWSDMQGNIKYANRKFQDIFGYTVEEIPNIDAWLLLAYPSPAYREQVLSLISLHIEAQTQGKETNPIELTVVCKNGSTRHVLQTMLFTSNRILVIYYDITERKRAEEVLQKTLDSLRKSFGVTVQVLVAAVEMRDPYTAGHQVRSSDIARAIAIEMGLDQKKIEGIRLAGSIHDIGKLSIPAEILSKPSKLI